VKNTTWKPGARGPGTLREHLALGSKGVRLEARINTSSCVPCVDESSSQTAQAGKRLDLEHAASAALPKRGAFGAPDHQVCDRPPSSDVLCTDACCTGQLSVNPILMSDASANDDGQRMDVEEPAAVTPTEQPAPIIRWKVGAEVRPLCRENPAAVALFALILSGTIVEWPTIEVSEAVAVLIYRLMLDKERRAAHFASSTRADVYVVLASRCSFCVVDKG
jgi:hypothetical protein